MENKGRFGLCYKLSKADKRTVTYEKREKKGWPGWRDGRLKLKGPPYVIVERAFGVLGLSFQAQ